MAVDYQDHYATLGVPRDAGDEDIRRAYRRLARENHPDVNSDPGAEDRFKAISQAYEVLRDPEKRARYDHVGEEAAGANGFDPGDFGDGDLGDLFESLFGGRGSFGGFGSDQEAVLELSLPEAARGGPRRLSLGDGRELDVQIPAGVRDGQVIRVPGQRLRLRVRLRPDNRFRLRGDDVETDVRVAPWEAALGATVDVATPEGHVKVKVPAGSSSGRRLRLRGAGLGGGHLYAVVKVVVPRKLSRKERQLFQQLADTSKFDARAD